MHLIATNFLEFKWQNRVPQEHNVCRGFVLEQQRGALWTSRLCVNLVKRSSRDLTCFPPSHPLPSTCCPCLDSRGNSSPPLQIALHISPSCESFFKHWETPWEAWLSLQSRDLTQANAAEMWSQNVPSYANRRGSSCPFRSCSGLPCLARISSCR